jgi:hypothetical protein
MICLSTAFHDQFKSSQECDKSIVLQIDPLTFYLRYIHRINPAQGFMYHYNLFTSCFLNNDNRYPKASHHGNRKADSPRSRL